MYNDGTNLSSLKLIFHIFRILIIIYKILALSSTKVSNTIQKVLAINYEK